MYQYYSKILPLQPCLDIMETLSFNLSFIVSFVLNADSLNANCDLRVTAGLLSILL